jgi:hypothetical protein
VTDAHRDEAPPAPDPALPASGPEPAAAAGPPPIRGGFVGRQWPLLIVLGGSAVGLLAVALDQFRVGCVVLGAATLFGGVARLVLPARRVGLLVVRSRPVDVVTLLVLGTAVVVLAVVVPPGQQ